MRRHFPARPFLQKQDCCLWTFLAREVEPTSFSSKLIRVWIESSSRSSAGEFVALVDAA